MRLNVIIFACALVAVAGCSKKPEPDPMLKACPEKTVEVVVRNQEFFQNEVVPGKTDAKVLKNMKGMVRKAHLEKDGMTKEVGFFLTSLPACEWFKGWSVYTPVVVSDGVIENYGATYVRDQTAHGWKLKEATWPWQNYSFGYLPKK